jgi:glutathione S-transferase
MKLYQFAWGIYPRRILVYLKEKGITDIEMVDVNVVAGDTKTPEFLARNPAATVPVLETGSGQHVCQSISILQYLEEIYPTPNLSGDTPEARARVRDQLLLVGEAYNLAGICTYYGSPIFAQRRQQTDEVARAFHLEYTHALENLDAMAGDRDYMGGTDPNIADIAFFASEQFMRDIYRISLPGRCERLAAIYERFLLRPSAAPEPAPEFVVQNAPVRDFLS